MPGSIHMKQAVGLDELSQEVGARVVCWERMTVVSLGHCAAVCAEHGHDQGVVICPCAWNAGDIAIAGMTSCSTVNSCKARDSNGGRVVLKGGAKIHLEL